MNLYEIDAEILNCIDTETGDIIDVEKLEALEEERDKKISNIGCWIKDLRAFQEAIKNEKKNLDNKLKVAANKEKQLVDFLDRFMEGATYKDARVTISYRKSTSTEVSEDLDVNSLPDELKKITVSADKTAIKEALQNGVIIDGCQLVEKNNIQIK